MILSGDRSARFPRIAHIITDLNGFGGTEITLLRYLKRSSINPEFHRVFVLKTIGVGDTLGSQMVTAGFSVVEFNLKKGIATISGLINLYREIRNFKPDLISGWLYFPSLLATVIAFFIKNHPPVVWHIRTLPVSSFTDLLKTPGRYVLQRVLAVLSRATNPLIVSNSSKAICDHLAIGFASTANRQIVIPNGIDLSEYYQSREEGLMVRSELGIPANAILIGSVGRFVPEKGYPEFFEALSNALEKLRPEISRRVHFLGAGNGVCSANASFNEIASVSLRKDRLHLLGKRADVPRLLRALDFFVLASISDAFPNALIEAMSTGLACIATDVGQCGKVLDTPDCLVPPSDTEKLANCIIKLVEMSDGERHTLGSDNRERIARHFELRKMVSCFDEVFCDAAGGVTR
jgi:glycosyltransferase involved in cell wall biosynthesis